MRLAPRRNHGTSGTQPAKVRLRHSDPELAGKTTLRVTLEERRPRLDGWIVAVSTVRGELTLRLDSDEPLAAAEVRFMSESGISFARDTRGVVPVGPDEVALSAFAYDRRGERSGMRPGQAVT